MLSKFNLSTAAILLTQSFVAQNKLDGVSKTLNAHATFSNKSNSEIQFTKIKELEATPVVSQGNTGTCWSFSSSSFFETEAMRITKQKDINLSEMFVVRNIYPLKAENFIRMHGRMQFAEGGEPHDVLYTLKNFGMVPEEVYLGRKDKSVKFNHTEMDTTLLGFAKAIAKSDGTINTDWKQDLQKKLDTYLGEIPASFDYKGKTYTPKSYAQSLGINPDDYVSLSSFTHHPYYSSFVVEVPDNWAWQTAYNLPLDEFLSTAVNAVAKGYSFAWASDVSEKYFRHKDAIAFVPDVDLTALTSQTTSEMALKPIKEKTITAELRQLAFDNFETQDDHAMHVVGLVKDQIGKNYFTVKNSWGDDSNSCGGYLYVSENYFQYKSISFLVHKDALSPVIKKKLGLK
jgi:bleomycin hydrolase